MSCTTVTETESTEIDVWIGTAVPCAIVDTSVVTHSESSGTIHTDESESDGNSQYWSTDVDEDASPAVSDNDSDTDYEDAREYLNSFQVTTGQNVAGRRYLTILGDIQIRNKLCHSINSILITSTVLVGIVFAYLQYRQQTWSNQMSALQTCLTLKEASSTLANSSFCNGTLSKGVQHLRMRLRRREETLFAYDRPGPPYMILLLSSVVLNVYLFLRTRSIATAPSGEADNIQSIVSEESMSSHIHVHVGLARSDHGVSKEISDSIRDLLHLGNGDQDSEVSINGIENASHSLLVQHIYHLHEKLFELRKERDSLKSEKSLPKWLIDTLYGRIDELEVQREALRKSMRVSQDDRDALRKKVDQLRELNDVSTKSMAEPGAEIDTSLVEITYWVNEKEKLYQQLMTSE